MKNAFGRIASIIVAFCVATVVNSHGQTVTTVFSLNASTGSTANSLVQGTDGNLFGTAELDGQNGLGSGYEVTPNGKLVKVVSFCSQTNCADGANPNAPLLLAADGNYYGTTNGGGANGKGGTVFKLSPGGQLTTLYSFCSQSNCADGGGPSVLVQGRDGNLYGITGAGGSGHQCSFRSSGCGTVFKITTKGLLTTLHSFCIESSCLDGYQPSSLALSTEGGFYGTAAQGGSSGNGTFFVMSPTGSVTALHSFTHTEGSYPNGVIEGTDGNFYGTTRVQGSTGNGTIFQITPSGQVNILYNFCSSSLCSDAECRGPVWCKAPMETFTERPTMAAPDNIVPALAVYPAERYSKLLQQASSLAYTVFAHNRDALTEAFR
ncbi:MAG TPA: choice-of-anchor tandem repeat GloVer-containing protein [Candidatus Sulfotelmatobacter sp.]|nr:choice-of-anchor tandem repeat GloVer-containing protein [Candidatus Sulfotelmatobacter sp.]